MYRSISFLILGFSGVAQAAGGFLVEPSGQVTGSTCQSYSLAVALAIKKDPAFRLDTASDLRKVESAIRAEIKKAAGAISVNHGHIQTGFAAYTNGKYKLQFKDVDAAMVGDEVGKRSGIINASAAPIGALLGGAVKDVVLASATKIGVDSYGDGHIFTIFGVDGPPNSNQKLLVLNSAVKVKNTQQVRCEDGIPDDPGPYTALLGWRKNSEFTFKPFGGKVRLWIVDK